MGNCKDCKWWESRTDMFNVSWHECNGLDWISRKAPVEKTEAALYAEAADDTGLEVGLLTGPLFGCTLFSDSNG